ncbi:uncharacterized protein B0I36DRAFT_319487 [Microdochium trichocladiopsis]|uniref:Uncharacterized protein n=1 Tax=Microdochium trichocladiopsis TaxID=1682393 RepID=A0A9P8YCR4_9PEZI|nr:uncharacterized protein B0I36DRAFT_319487 [Microdochium trichocladiopsis]KAH7035976.1 hypothetical protein B0I36DRAFT_319487 [Microdochium trichocladiopsis]
MKTHEFVALPGCLEIERTRNEVLINERCSTEGQHVLKESRNTRDAWHFATAWLSHCLFLLGLGDCGPRSRCTDHCRHEFANIYLICWEAAVCLNVLKMYLCWMKLSLPAFAWMSCRFWLHMLYWTKTCRQNSHSHGLGSYRGCWSCPWCAKRAVCDAESS